MNDMPLHVFFFGTFDPVTSAHLQAIYTLADTVPTEQITIIPAVYHRWGKQPASLQHRVSMITLGISNLPASIKEKCQVSLVETQPGLTGYTIDTLQYFLKSPQCQSHSHGLLLGSDAYADLPNWHLWQEIVSLVTIYVFPRGTTKNIKDISPKTILLPRRTNDPLRDVSSTRIRINIANHQAVDLPTNVFNYIQQHHLYQLETINRVN